MLHILSNIIGPNNFQLVMDDIGILIKVLRRRQRDVLV
jgi:hypothetical protein